MSTLEIRHVAETRFKVVRFHDNKAAPETEVPTPYGYPVGGRPSSHLMQDLRWYLEIFLEYPFDPDTYTAERILTALEKWGREAFAALFDNMIAGSFFTDITKNGYDKLTLHIKSDHPAVLSWPWEALHDGIAGGALGNLCKIERRIDTIPDPIDISAKLPTDKVNILLVTARPFTRDVRYRSISRKLVELIAEKQLPANVHLLRPPTFARLCEHLTERPHYYHIVHFDGHGAFGVLQSDNSGPWHGDPNKFEANHGHLIFETAEGDPDPVRTEILSPLLREHAIPAVVLNACQSAMVDASAADPFASVAAGLLQSGIRSVVAMAYSLYVSGAEEFLPVFYRHLFRTGDTAEALRKGRQQMFAQPKRISRRGPYPLQDWLVPVAYQQEPFKFSFADRVVTPSDRDEDKPRVKVEIPEKILEERPYGFIGRDSLLLELERAIRRRPGAILIHGVGGVGKTTLVQGFIRWLHDTDGLGQGCIWIRFTEEIRSAEYILNQLGGFLGEQFLSLGTWDKVKELARYMHQTRLFVVWDNFETAAGIPGTSLAACLAPDQLDILKHLMVSIKGGRGKIIVTSRSEETWLGKERVKLSIGGLEGEERWEFLDRVLHDLGIKVDREDKNLSDLVERLGGHPLAMQIVLPMLEDRTPQTLLGMYEAGLAKITTAGVGEIDKFFSTLHMAEQYLDESLRPLLIPLGLHERYFQIPLFEDMCVAAEEPQAAKRIHSFVPALAGMGLLHLKFPEMGVYEMHPAFGSYLRARATAEDPIREKWTRAFVDVMGNLADDIAGKTVQVQRPVFHIHGVNFHHALQEAVHLKMEQKVGALLQFLASYAQNTFNFDRAQTLFEQLVTNRRNLGWLEGEAAAFHHLGMVAEKRRELDSAEQWYRKALQILETRDMDHGAARTYHQMGIICEKRRDLKSAEKWYRKALKSKEKHGDEHGAASTYHQLGRIAQERRDFDSAEQLFRKSVEASIKQGDEIAAANSYHHMGIIAQLRHDYDSAEQWYREALKIDTKLGNEHGASFTYHQLGRVAKKRRKFDTAEQWYRKSLQIKERGGDQLGAAGTYRELGVITRERCDYDAAERWYRKSLLIEKELANEHGVALSYHGLGIIAHERRDFEAAEQWYRKSIQIEERHGNAYSVASTYYEMGLLKEATGESIEAGKWLVSAVRILQRMNDPFWVEQATNVFFRLVDSSSNTNQGKLIALWNEAGLGNWQKNRFKSK